MAASWIAHDAYAESEARGRDWEKTVACCSLVTRPLHVCGTLRANALAAESASSTNIVRDPVATGGPIPAACEKSESIDKTRAADATETDSVRWQSAQNAPGTLPGSAAKAVRAAGYKVAAHGQAAPSTTSAPIAPAGPGAPVVPVAPAAPAAPVAPVGPVKP